MISIVLAIMAGGAPTVYSFLGERFSAGIGKESFLRIFNVGMAALLLMLLCLYSGIMYFLSFEGSILIDYDFETRHV